MKIVQVTYTTQSEFALQNTANIQQVMDDLKKLNHPGLFYHVCQEADGKTFIHTAFFETDTDNQVLIQLPSFKHFQEQLKTSMPEVAPKQQPLHFIGSSNPFFNS